MIANQRKAQTIEQVNFTITISTAGLETTPAT